MPFSVVQCGAAPFFLCLELGINVFDGTFTFLHIAATMFFLCPDGHFTLFSISHSFLWAVLTVSFRYFRYSVFFHQSQLATHDGIFPFFHFIKTQSSVSCNHLAELCVLLICGEAIFYQAKFLISKKASALSLSHNISWVSLGDIAIENYENIR